MKNNSNAVLLRRVNPWSLLLILAVSLLLPLGAAAQNGSFPPPLAPKKKPGAKTWVGVAGLGAAGGK